MADSFDVEYLLRKRHNILENIFEYLDNQSLTTCREVSNSWKNFIDKRNYPWTRIVDKYFPKEVDKIDFEDDSTQQLYLAASTGQTEKFETLFEAEDEKNPCNSEGFTPFLLAARKGHFQICDFALQKVKDLNIDLDVGDFIGTHDNDGHQALHWSCHEGHSKVVEIILENSDNRKRYLNEKDDDGWSPLHLACRGGHLSVVEMIFNKAQELIIDLNATDNGNLTSFHWVCLEGYFEVAKHFVEKSHELKIDLNVKDTEMEWTPFHYACYEGRTDIVELMLENSESQTIYIRCDLYDHFARTGFDLVEDEETADVIANFRKRQKEAKSAKMADIKSKMMLGQKLLKKGMLAKMKK